MKRLESLAKFGLNKIEHKSTLKSTTGGITSRLTGAPMAPVGGGGVFGNPTALNVPTDGIRLDDGRA